MQLRTRAAALTAAALTALAATTAASAHVIVTPAKAPAGSLQRLSFSVASEDPASPTVKVTLRIPAQILRTTVPALKGWRSSVTTQKLARPVTVGGKTVTARVATVTWTATGAGLAPDTRGTFVIMATLPALPGLRLWFPAVQTFRSGAVDRWLGPADADEPAPNLLVTAKAGA